MKSDWGISEGKMWETLVDGNILHNGYNIGLQNSKNLHV